MHLQWEIIRDGGAYTTENAHVSSEFKHCLLAHVIDFHPWNDTVIAKLSPEMDGESSGNVLLNDNHSDNSNSHRGYDDTQRNEKE